MTEPDERARTKQRAVLAVVAFAVVIAVAVALTGLGAKDPGEPNESSQFARSSDPVRSASLPPERQIQEVLDDQVAALRSGDRSAFLARWVPEPAAQRAGRDLFANATALDMQVGAVRHLPGSVSAAAPEVVPVLDGEHWEAWEVDVAATWRIARFVPSQVTSTLTYVFVVRGGLVRIGGLRAAEGHPSPVWLLGRLAVSSSTSTMAVATSEPAAEALRSDLDTAVADVRAVLPDWRGRLLAILPARQTDAEGLLGGAPRAYEDVAATTTIAGSSAATAAGLIVANPATFNRLTGTGRHVVITHEAAHVATHDITVDMPRWVAEGFADYVGVGAVDERLPVSAALALRQVSRQGPPTSVPADAAFNGSDPRTVETAYELARLAWLHMAEEYGRQALIGFHAYVVRRPHDVEGAFVGELGVTQPEFTRDWRRYLAGLAD